MVLYLGVDWENVQQLEMLLKRPPLVWAQVSMFPEENLKSSCIGIVRPITCGRSNKLPIFRSAVWHRRDAEVFVYQGGWPSGRKGCKGLVLGQIVRWASAEEVEEAVGKGFLKLRWQLT